VEKNKVYGKIILNRSKLSGLSKLDLSNIRITATDSKGRTYVTLSNKNGEFVLFAPVTDQYSVSINNIFYENFDLRQNNFKVQFNGYKQFEVNFVFDEKIRRINFSNSAQDGQFASILQVRRTNLKGLIKDANSLTPIRARINLVNTKNNSIMTSVYSSSQSGEYSTSFMADDNYLVEILADGYWYHSENLNLNQVTTFLNVTKDILLKPIAIGSKIELNIKFESTKTDLDPESVAELNRLIKLLKDNGNIKVEVQGHSDDLEALNNPQISEERAKKVARYLIENGFSNIQIRGFGNTVPLSSNDTEQGRAANRRVEIEVVSK
jgi:outer membrane protein OmpA-like peptidoglycan-associated protein